LAACCGVLGYWSIGNSVGRRTLILLVTISLLVAPIVVPRPWKRRPFWLRYRAAIVMACCVAAACLPAGAAFGSTKLVPPCAAPTELTVLTSQEDLAAVQAAIPGFEQNEPTRVHTACYAVDVTAYAAPTDSDAWRGLETGWGASALSTVGPRPDIWIPSSSAELTAVGEDNGPRLTSLGSIASSPLVIAVPTGLVSGPLAQLPRVRSTWDSIYNALRHEHIGLAIPDPVVSETALLGIAGLYPALNPADERGIESSGSFPADSGNLLCDAAQTAEGSNRPASAYLVSEAALLIASNAASQLSEGACATSVLTQTPEKLTAFYPVGAAALDFPFTTVQWDGSTAVRSTLSRYETDFYDWLTGKGRPKLAGAGLRPPGCGTFSQPPAGGITRVVPHCGTANLPTAEAAADALSSFLGAQAPAHIVIGIDDSGPMQPYLPQITAAVDAELGLGATHVGSRDSFGIWKLPGDQSGQIDQQLVGFGVAGVTGARVPADVGVLTGHDHSADYAMLTQAGQVLYAQSATSPEPSNSVILLTDGDGYPLGDPGGSNELSVTRLFDQPQSGYSAIKLYIIAFGPEGCAESETNSASQSVATFADATGGTCLQPNGADPTPLLAEVLGQISTGS
jgi:Bacterial extracellular solute-binding protein